MKPSNSRLSLSTGQEHNSPWTLHGRFRFGHRPEANPVLGGLHLNVGVLLPIWRSDDDVVARRVPNRWEGDQPRRDSSAAT